MKTLLPQQLKIIIAILWLTLVSLTAPAHAQDRQIVRPMIFGEFPPESGVKDVGPYLKRTLVVETNNKTTKRRLYIFIVKDAKITASYVSEPTLLEKGPPHQIETFPADAFPPDEFFKGLTIKSFLGPNRGRMLAKSSEYEEMAKIAYDLLEENDGIYIVVGWDGIKEKDYTVGMAGVGTWDQ